jgi:hypothetical protein
MHDLSRAPATAVCSGMSVSSPANATAADLHEARPEVSSTQVDRSVQHFVMPPRRLVNYLRRTQGGEGDASGGRGAPRTRRATGEGRSADLATAAAERAKDAISPFSSRSRNLLLSLNPSYFFQWASNELSWAFDRTWYKSFFLSTRLRKKPI